MTDAPRTVIGAVPESGLTRWPRRCAGATIPAVPVSVVIVDDHPGFRAMARRMLEDGGLSVLAEADDGRSALEAVAALRPELVLLDVQLPDMDGFAVAAELERTSPATAVVLTSVRAAAHFGARVDQSPARGFVPKADLSAPALLRLLRAPA